MRDVIVALPGSISLHDVATALDGSPFEIVRSGDESLSVYLDDEVVQIVLDNSLAEHYEEAEELELLGRLGHEPNFFLVSFKNTRALGQVLEWTADSPNAIVDNDFGVVESGCEFVRRFRECRDWDWVG